MEHFMAIAVGAKWRRFSETELSALKNKDDLVTQVVAKYSLDKAQAQRDVDETTPVGGLVVFDAFFVIAICSTF